MDLSKLKPGDWVLGVSGIVLFISSFLPWFGKSFDAGFGVRGSVSGNGWDTGFLWGGIPALLGIALVGLVVVQRFTDVELPDVGSLGWGMISLIAGAVGGGLVVLKLLIGYSEFGVSLDRKWGLFVATAAGIGLVVGGFLRMQEEKAGSTGGATPPPSA
jgi:hypothetical protein